MYYEFGNTRKLFYRLWIWEHRRNCFIDYGFGNIERSVL